MNRDPSVKVLIASGYAPEDELHKEIRPLVKGFFAEAFCDDGAIRNGFGMGWIVIKP